MRLEDLDDRRVLVALSGGLDSVFTLWKVLAETGAETHAHHVVIAGGNDARTAAEGEAVAQCAAWLARHVRPFGLGHSTLDIRTVADGTDVEILEPSLLAAAAAARCDHILLGLNSDDVAAGSTLEPIEALDPAPSREQEVAELPVDLAALTMSCRIPVERRGRLAPCGLCGPCLRLARLIPRYDPYGDRHLAIALSMALADPSSALARALANVAVRRP